MFAREICKKEGINIVYSEAYDSIKYLYEINRIAEISKTDYDFSKELFEMPVIDRRSWIEKRIEEKIDNIGDFERAMKALEKVKFGE